MQVSAIPAFIDRSKLTISRVTNENLKSEIEAVDPQGDSVIVTRTQSDTGNTCVMPDVSMQVAYKQAAPEQVVTHTSIGSDESYELYRSLQHAEKPASLGDPFQVSMDMGWIMADLASHGGAGGAC